MAAIFKTLKTILRKTGDITSTVFLTVFYFTFFALFAAPARLWADFLRKRKEESNFVRKKKTIDSLEDFRYEG